MEKNFIKVRSTKDIIISATLIIAGIVCILIPSGVSLNILGALLIAAGLFLVFALKTACKDPETGKVYKKIERFFPQSKKDALLTALKSDLTSIDLQEEDKGTGLRADIYYDGKDSVFVQLYEYVPYQYQVCSPCFEFTAEHAQKLLA